MIFFKSIINSYLFCPFLVLLISEYITTARSSCEIKPHHSPILPITLSLKSGTMSKMPKITISTTERAKRNRRCFNLFIIIPIYLSAKLRIFLHYSFIECVKMSFYTHICPLGYFGKKQHTIILLLIRR